MRNFSSILLIVAVLMSFSSVFVVKEGQRAIVLLFSKVQKDSEDNAVVYGPGLHFKVPFFSQVKQLDARIQTLDGAPDRFVTSEKKDLIPNQITATEILAIRKRLYNKFGKERVTDELNEFLKKDFFPRSGGGIGVTRMIRAMKLSNLI